DLISSTAVQNASCLAFEKLVSFLGKNFTYNSSEFGREDVYSTIRSYLRAGSGAKCYNSSDPELNSTSWFSNYIGSFVMFITLDDLTSFVSTSQIKVFLEDEFNLDLFSNIAIPANVTSYYIQHSAGLYIQPDLQPCQVARHFSMLLGCPTPVIFFSERK
ncbi:hypothetical protein CHARACLAT_026108, partial [Characodon lateralis]|nr:hypothetical protein [Characodon lateralis]